LVAVDTNVLLRVLVDDPGNAGQCAAARRRVRQAERVYVSEVVLAETVWVLVMSYQFDKQEVLETFARLLENERFVFRSTKVVMDALGLYVDYPVDFADCLILSDGRTHGAPLLSFDQKLAKLEGVTLVR